LKERMMGQKPRQAPQNVPDSLPPRDPGTDVLPDDVRRTDRSRRVPPDSLPATEDDTSADGGVAQHPVHDSDEEDRGPEDYERATDTETVASVDRVLRRRG
jgi:hypothetical protein